MHVMLIIRVWLALGTQPIQAIDEYRGAALAGLWSDLGRCDDVANESDAPFDAYLDCMSESGL